MTPAIQAQHCGRGTLFAHEAIDNEVTSSSKALRLAPLFVIEATRYRAPALPAVRLRRHPGGRIPSLAEVCASEATSSP